MIAGIGSASLAYAVSAATTALVGSLTPETIRQKAIEIVSRPEYQLDQGLDDESQALWLTLLSWILKPFVWVFESLNGLPLVLRILVVILLAVIAVALIIHIVWSIVSAVRGTKAGVLVGAKDRERIVDPGILEQSAERAAAGGQYLDAVRFLFRAALIRIEQSETKKLRPGITNRELLRRYQKSPLSGPLSQFVDMIDRKWYGAENCEFTDFEICRSQHSSIREVLQGRHHAVGA